MTFRINVDSHQKKQRQFQSFEYSSLFAYNSCVYCTTRYNKCGRIRTKWLFFFTFIEECCVVTKKNIDKKLANRISYQIWYKRCLVGKFGGGSKSEKRGSYPPADLDRGGPNLRWHWRYYIFSILFVLVHPSDLLVHLGSKTHKTFVM